MSDEMVPEKTETAAPAAPEENHAEEHPGTAPADAPVSAPVAAATATTEEPAPAQPVAPAEAHDTPAAPEENHAEEHPGTAPADAPVSVPVAPVAAIAAETPPAPPAAPTPDEPAPVQPVAAASTPPQAEGPTAEDTGSDAAAFDAAMQAMDLNSQYDQSLRQLQEGDVITGTVMRVDREGVLVDVGAKSEGIIRLNELSRDAGSNVNPDSIVKVGEQIKVYVLEPENQDGNPILSKKRADFEQAWEKVQAAKETGETLHAMVTDRVKGGLVVDLGIRGFVPASHVGSGSLKNNLDKYVGQSIALKVIEVDKDRRKVVLSNKLAVQEERESRSAETKASLAPGQIRHGIVRRLTNYGAFIDLGGIDGLLHISEMSWTRINDPKEILREGQELDVLILKMDLENNRVSLGLRQILPDPWSEIADRYKEGDEITGTVTRIVPFGAFVQVPGGVEGIIPNMELPRTRGSKSNSGVAVNEEVKVKVLQLRPEERKMTLSMRALQPPEEREAPPAPREGGAREGGGRDGGAREGGGREAGGREGGGREGGKRGRGGEREEREDYSRYAPGRQEEPRFTIGDAFAAAKGRERNKRDRRSSQEQDSEEYDEFEEIEEETAEPEPEAEAEKEE